MPYRISHVHLKANDPKAVADWYVKAFNFQILSDEVRVFGDRFIRCKPEASGDFIVIISSARTGETLAPSAGKTTHLGIEHFAFDSEDVAADIKKLTAMGAEVAEGPRVMPNGNQLVFLNCPGDARIELIQPAKKA